MTRATRTKIIVSKDPELQLEAVRTGRSQADDDEPPPVAARQEAAAQTKQPAGDEQTRAGIRGRRRDIGGACSICGARSHTEYFCPYNYMDGRLSTRACREQCIPGRHAMPADSEGCQDCFVRVTNVPSSLSERELRRIFQRFGPLRKCAISRAGPEGGAGFGFVTFEERGDAEEAINDLNGHRVGDRRLRVDWAYPRAHHA